MGKLQIHVYRSSLVSVFGTVLIVILNSEVDGTIVLFETNLNDKIDVIVLFGLNVDIEF